MAASAAGCGFASQSVESAIEQLCARYHACDALLTDSGTSALILAIRSIVPAGGTVAYPGYSCIDITAAAVAARVRVRLYDLDPATLSPDLESLEQCLKRGVDAIVVSHLYGYPADVSTVRDIGARHCIPVIEDSAQAAGGKLGGVRLGGIGEISILSFGRGKGATTGAGGAVLVRTPALVEWVREARHQLGSARRGGKEVGALAAQLLLSHPLLYRLPASVPALKLGEMVYRSPKRPARMPASSTAMLTSVLRRDDSEIETRRARANDLVSRVKASGRIVPIRPIAGGDPGFLRFAVTDTTGHISPNPALGIMRGYPLTLEQHQQLQPFLESGETAGKGSKLLRDRLLTLPTHSRVAPRDHARLCEWLVASS